VRSASTYKHVSRATVLVIACASVVVGCGAQDTTVTPAEMKVALDAMGSGYVVHYTMLDHRDDQLAAGTIAALDPRKVTKFCLARQHVTLPAECKGLIAAGGWADVIVHTEANSLHDAALRKLTAQLRAAAPDVE
jgi:hypothetical protein